MKKEINLHAEPLTEKALADLENRGLVARFQPPADIADRPEEDAAKIVYLAGEKSGPHQLLCVRKTVTEIKLTDHDENEEVIFVDPKADRFRPLYLIIGLDKTDKLKEKARQGKLSAADFKALRVRYNDPATCVFSILKDVPHCEITVPGKKEAPVFFVTEPHKVGFEYLDFEGAVFKMTDSAL